LDRIADADELRERLSTIIRGEPMDCKGGRAPTVTEQLKAIDLLGRTTGLWQAPYAPKAEPVVFWGDDELGDGYDGE